MNNNKGITLVALIITIIVIIILASISIYYGLTNNTDRAVETKVIYEVNEVLDAVSSRALLNKLNHDYYVLVGDNSFGTATNEDGISYNSNDGWYIVNSKEQFDELGITNATGEYIVNYKTGQVVSQKAIMYNGTEYYSLNQLNKEFGGGITAYNGTYDEKKGVNVPILIKGMVPVKYYGGSWVIASSDDDSWYDYSAGQKAWANIMLMDELEVSGYSNEEVKNASLSELVGKTVTKEGSGYVWIPRYAISSSGKVIFSNLTKDTTDHNGEQYTVPDAFENFVEGLGTTSLTGIWVSKYEAGFNN